MRKLLTFSALATIAIAAPTVASAQGLVYGRRRPRLLSRPRLFTSARWFYGHDRGWHRGWYHRYGDRDVIIRRHHYWD